MVVWFDIDNPFKCRWGISIRALAVQPAPLSHVSLRGGNMARAGRRSGSLAAKITTRLTRPMLLP
jgi:hypothetical protein